MVDTVAGLMDNKIMIIDGAVVVTGSFNYTCSVEHRNAKNQLVIHDPELAALDAWNSRLRAARSGSLAGRKRLLRKSVRRRHQRLARAGGRRGGEPPQHDLPVARLPRLRFRCGSQPGRISRRERSAGSRLPSREELPVFLSDRALTREHRRARGRTA